MVNVPFIVGIAATSAVALMILAMLRFVQVSLRDGNTLPEAADESDEGDAS